MATTYQWIHIGRSTTALDPTEGNTNNEGYAAFQNQTWGTATDPLFTHVTTVTAGNFAGGAANALDTNNNIENATLTTNIGNGTQTFTYDGTAIYNATITYVDGTTATITAVRCRPLRASCSSPPR